MSRDFADVLILSRRHSVAATKLLAAVTATAEHRQVTLRPLAALLGGLGVERQRAWSTFTTHAALDQLVPTDYSEALALVTEFTDPLLGGIVTTGSWDPQSQSWLVGEPS